MLKRLTLATLCLHVKKVCPFEARAIDVAILRGSRKHGKTARNRKFRKAKSRGRASRWKRRLPMQKAEEKLQLCRIVERLICRTAWPAIQSSMR
jgi:hypothetical protein